jgi:hypothetical protein
MKLLTLLTLFVFSDIPAMHRDEKHVRHSSSEGGYLNIRLTPEPELQFAEVAQSPEAREITRSPSPEILHDKIYVNLHCYKNIPKNCVSCIATILANGYCCQRVNVTWSAEPCSSISHMLPSVTTQEGQEITIIFDLPKEAE